jgi:general secretion pathway protein K
MFLAIIANAVALTGRRETRIATDERLSAAVEAAADGGIHEAIARLAVAGPDGWGPSPIHHQTRIGAAQVDVAIADESGMINPNLASPQLLISLFQTLGTQPPLAAELAAKIVDWRDPKANPATAAGFAAQYRAAGLGYVPAHTPFGSIDELGAILGMPADLLRRARPHLGLENPGSPSPEAADAVVHICLAQVPDSAAKPAQAGGAAPVRRYVDIDSLASRDGILFRRHAVVVLSEGGRFQILRWEAPSIDREAPASPRAVQR